MFSDSHFPAGRAVAWHWLCSPVLSRVQEDFVQAVEPPRVADFLFPRCFVVTCATRRSLLIEVSSVCDSGRLCAGCRCNVQLICKVTLTDGANKFGNFYVRPQTCYVREPAADIYDLPCVRMRFLRILRHVCACCHVSRSFTLLKVRCLSPCLLCGTCAHIVSSGFKLFADAFVSIS